MDGLVIGLDLCDEYTEISCFDQEQVWNLSTVICRNKNKEEWYVGEEAYAHALAGEGVIVDKLLKLAMKEGTATIAGVKYEAGYLLCKFLEQILMLPEKAFSCDRIEQIVVTLQELDRKKMDLIKSCLEQLGLSPDRIHIASHSESFIYYTLSQKKEVWNSHVGLFELSDERLCYYELKVQRGMKQMMVIAESESLEEGFNLDILSTTSGARLADKILCSCGERLLQKKLFSAVFLTGKGFDSQDWASEFMQMVCSKRRVYGEPNLFSKGASFQAADYTRENTVYPFASICEGRLNASIAVPVVYRERESQLVLAAAGASWYETKNAVEFIADHQKDLELVIVPAMDSRKKRTVKIPLEGFPDRDDKTVKIQVRISFLDEKTMAVEVVDQGFGELYPKTEAALRQEVML